jgi:hypothetical protein
MLDATKQEYIIITCAVFAILFGIVNAYLVLKIDVSS